MTSSTITAPSYDPVTTATGLAQKYVATSQDAIDTQTKTATATSKALTDLSSAIGTFQTALSSLTGTSTSTLLTQSATFSDATIGSATASASVVPGSYSFYVERLAAASQVAYGVTDTSVATGTSLGSFDVNLGGAFGFTIKLDDANADHDGTLTVRELAAAINASADNKNRVTASILTVSGMPQLVLTSNNTGLANAVSLDATKVTDTGLQSALSNGNELVAAQDATVWLGDKVTGIAMTQATNTFTNIEGVSMTFTRTSTSPVTLTVARDDSGTTGKVQKFVDAFNKLKSALDGLIASGDPSKNVAAGAFAQDAGVRALQARLVSLVRPTATGTSLASYGIIANRDGTLDLDATRLTKALQANPNGLDTVIGSSAAGKSSGIAGALDSYLKSWNSSTGQIHKRQEANDKLQSSLNKRRDDLQKQYDSAYQRYLQQFTQLQTLQSKMQSNVSMFDAMFSNNSN